MICLIYGEERFLMEQKLASLKKEYNCNDENMNISVFRGDEDRMKDVYEDLITPPFFTDNKMVILKNPHLSSSFDFVCNNSHFSFGPSEEYKCPRAQNIQVNSQRNV